MGSTSVRYIFADHDAIVSYCKTALLLGGKPAFAAFMGQGILLDLIKNSSSRRSQNGESAADDTPRDIIQTTLICVDLRYRLSYPR